MMGNQLKGEETASPSRSGGRPPGRHHLRLRQPGQCRGYAVNPQADVPRKQEGKLDVGARCGAGSLTIIKDLGMWDPYVGSIALVSGEIAEDVTAYFAESEQIPTACALGVLGRGLGEVITAGAISIQLLPGAGEETIS